MEVGIEMKRRVLAAALLPFFATSSFAADMLVKAPPPPAPATSSWTGFYVGLHAGGAWQSNQTDTFADPNGFLGPVSANASSKLGAVGGFHAGYNWEFSPAWVAGIEGDFSWASVNNNVTVTPLFLSGVSTPNTRVSMSAGPNWLSSVRGRLGFVGWANTMFYATGGVAWADMRHGGLENNSPPTFVTNFLSDATFSKIQTGWVAGGGVEYPVTEHVLLRAEYLYYAFDGTTASANLLPNPGAFPVAFNYGWSRENIQVSRVGLSYKF